MKMRTQFEPTTRRPFDTWIELATTGVINAMTFVIVLIALLHHT